MPAPSAADITTDPKPLNAFRAFPFRIDPFPARILFAVDGANLAAGQQPAKDQPANPLRKEP
jgi:hypothetical protein